MYTTVFLRSLSACALAGAALFGMSPTPVWATSSFTLFESGQVRPLALSPDGKRLYAVNTPDNRLEIFRIGKHGLRHQGSVPVGLEPVAVAVRAGGEVWVVNHLSDSVSIVRADTRRSQRVVRTLLVGDEPRDIVFAGPGHGRAFITTAHRGQNAYVEKTVHDDPQLTTPGVGRADVWVFDADHLGDSLGGDELTVITLFTDTPRALAATPDGSRVYAAGFATGNRTTAITEDVVTRNGGLPPPPISPFPLQAPAGLIVKYDGTHWVDELMRQWDSYVMFSLPDKDVFAIDANATPPAQLPDPIGYYQGVGTMLFNMVVNPVNGHVYVSNTDAQNAKRFEGFNAQDSVRGHLAESRITVLTSTSVLPRHLNKHIDYSQCCAPIPNDENRLSLAFPMDMAISRDGTTLYVAAFGSSKVGVYDTAALESDSFVPSLSDQIEMNSGTPCGGGPCGEGPAGLALDESRHRLYVLTRFNNSIAVVDTIKRRQIDLVPMYNPEPESVVKGRRFLHDASFTSSHGDSACASCHVFGDFDSLAWDLGNLSGESIKNPGPFTVLASQFGLPDFVDFQALKGPMTTQSLRGLANHGPMHWRGDRTGGNDEVSQQPDSGTFDEDAAFKKFNIAFQTLNGRDVQIDDQQMQAFTDFILQISYPPNPIRNLDNSLTPDQQAGRNFYFGTRVSDTFFNCNGCHVLDREGNAGGAKPGFFGTDGRYSFEAEPQVFKIPHLRNLYQKVGKFGMPESTQLLPLALMDNNGFLGDQVKGFGFLHDGSVDTVFRFISARVFAPRAPGTTGPKDPGNLGGFPLDASGFLLRKQMEQFLLAFDSNLAPIVGQQVTLTRHNAAEVGPRINLLIARAEEDECDLVAKNRQGGFLYVGNGEFRFSRKGIPKIPDPLLRATAHLPGGEITYTCVPPGSGPRIGLDRDDDGILDGNDDG